MARILHIAAHLGAGVGKAISGLAVADKANEHSIYLLDTPQKFNHINFCRENGVPIHFGGDVANHIEAADVVIINWWGHKTTDELIERIPRMRGRVALWMHCNGIHNPPLPQAYLDASDIVMVTSLYSQEDKRLRDSVLVYGFGAFEPEKMSFKTDYSQTMEYFTIGYVGTPTYKKLPADYTDYCRAVVGEVPDVRFVMVGETSCELRSDVERAGLEPYFDFAGWSDDVIGHLLKFDVFGYLLGYSMTFATTENCVLEALAAGLPCVVSREPLGKYLLEDRVSGILAGNPKEYAQAIKQLYDDKRLRESIGKSGREYCIEKYKLADNLRRFNSAIKR